MARARLCSVCDTPLQLTHLHELTGVENAWHVQLLQFPVLACPRGHDRREAYADFNVDWSEYLGYRAPIWSSRKGLLRRRHVCPRCGMELREPALGQLDLEAQGRGDFRFSVVIRGPMRRCQSCATSYLAASNSAEVFEALANALTRGRVKRY